MTQGRSGGVDRKVVLAAAAAWLGLLAVGTYVTASVLSEGFDWYFLLGPCLGLAFVFFGGLAGIVFLWRAASRSRQD